MLWLVNLQKEGSEGYDKTSHTLILVLQDPPTVLRIVCKLVIDLIKLNIWDLFGSILKRCFMKFRILIGQKTKVAEKQIECICPKKGGH